MDSNSGSRPPVDNLNPLPAGTRLQEFVIERLIGIGGFGIVYQANDTLLHRTVAIKEYMPTSMASRSDGATVSLRSVAYTQDFETGKRSFINEARMLARFKHSALIEVFRFWEQNSTAYMATPFYEGRTLKERLRETPGVPEEGALKQVLMPVLDALEHMHREQVYHRDISPDNIMILNDGRPILLDLGAARRVEAENAQALTVLVKPGYAPIEQYAGDSSIQQGPWTDIYGLGASAYFALIGKPPPPSASRIMSDSIIKLATVKPEGYSHAFLSAMDAALAVRPDDRPQSVAALRAMIAMDPPLVLPDEALADLAESTKPTEAADPDEMATIVYSGKQLQEAVESFKADATPNPTVLARPVTVPVAAMPVPESLFKPDTAPLAVPVAAAVSAPAPAPAPAVAPKPVITPPAASKPAAPVNSAAKAKKGMPTGLIAGGLIGVSGLVAALWWFAKPATKPDSAKPPIASTESAAPQAAITPPVPSAEAAKPAATTPEAGQAASEKTETTKGAEVKSAPEATPTPAVTSAPTPRAGTAAPTAVPTTADTPAAAPPAEVEAKVVDKPGVARFAIKPWGQVYVNGESKGVSPPMKSISLPAGDYTIEIRNGDYPSHRVKVKLKSGEVFKVNHAFSDATQKNKDY
jgi:non-specific serine/threonine protein kinase